MKRPTNREVRQMCENAGGDYHVFLEIRNTEGDPIAAFEGPATKPWVKVRIAPLILLASKERRGFALKRKRP